MLAGVESGKKLKIDNEESASSGGSASVPLAVSRILRDTLQKKGGTGGPPVSSCSWDILSQSVLEASCSKF
jgi:hypothetical protein